jgi:Icc-related predicted phosphoesterase
MLRIIIIIITGVLMSKKRMMSKQQRLYYEYANKEKVRQELIEYIKQEKENESIRKIERSTQSYLT